MYCQFCGEEIDFYDISYQQCMGVEVDGEDGVPVEAQRFVSAGVCNRCGTTNHREHVDYVETNLLSHDNTEKRFAELPY